MNCWNLRQQVTLLGKLCFLSTEKMDNVRNAFVPFFGWNEQTTAFWQKINDTMDFYSETADYKPWNEWLLLEIVYVYFTISMLKGWWIQWIYCLMHFCHEHDIESYVLLEYGASSLEKTMRDFKTAFFFILSMYSSHGTKWRRINKKN